MARRIINLILLFLVAIITFSFSIPCLYASTLQITKENRGLEIRGNYVFGEVDSNAIVKVIYLNNQLAVDPLGIFGPTFGHTAIILVKSDGSGIYYSKGFTGASDWEIFRDYYVEGQIDKHYLTSDDMANFTPEGSGVLPIGPNAGYQYTRYISISVTEDMGNQMLKMAEMKYNSKPLIYNLYHDNCNQFVQQVMEAAKINFIFIDMIPNLAYKVGALIWPNSSSSYDLNAIDKIRIAASDLSTEAGSGFGNLLNQMNLIESSAAQPQGTTEISKVAAETPAPIPPPSKPSLSSPYNWYQSLGGPPMLMWKGDSNSSSYYVVVNSSNTGNVESGWINSTSWKPNLPNENYIYTWKVKAKNSQGAESPWSDDSHFSTASTTLKFEGDISFSPPSPSSANQIKIFASTTGWGGVGITLRVSVNTAPDGSANGEWIILKELGVPKFTENDAPIWDTTGLSNGTYKIRVEAKGKDDPNWQNPSVIEATYKLINKSTTSSSTTTTTTSSTSSNGKADLVAANIKFYEPRTTNEVSPQAGRTVTAFAVLQNTGGQGTGVFNVKWFLDGQQVGYGSHANLNPGETSGDNIRYDWAVTAGNHTLTFVADCDNNVGESNEGNNNFQTSVNVPDITSETSTSTSTTTTTESSSTTSAATTTNTVTASNTFDFEVSGVLGWQSTNITVNAGQQIQITYNGGSWAGRTGFGPSLPDIWTDAGGIDFQIYYPEYGITNRFASLIGKIGDGSILPIGLSSDFKSEQTGTLFLRMFDIDMSDNAGSINVRVIVK